MSCSFSEVAVDVAVVTVAPLRDPRVRRDDVWGVLMW